MQPNQQSTTTCVLPVEGTYTLRCFDSNGGTWNSAPGSGGQLELIVASGEFEWEGVYCDQTADDGVWCARVASALPPLPPPPPPPRACLLTRRLVHRLCRLDVLDAVTFACTSDGCAVVDPICPPTCSGYSCDHWNGIWGSTCLMNEINYGCDCSGCECPDDYVDGGGCPPMCNGFSCDEWNLIQGSTCSIEENDWGCDCSGCECPDDVVHYHCYENDGAGACYDFNSACYSDPCPNGGNWPASSSSSSSSSS